MEDRRPKLNCIGPYVLGKTIGEGSFGKVKMAFDEKTGEKVAIKIIDKAKIREDSKTLERTMREIGILKIIRHPHIIQFIDVIDSTDRIYVILEFVEGGELFDYIVAHQRLKENRAKKIFKELVEAIEYIHSLNIIHRDLKPENILLDHQKRIKLIDFGLSNTLRRDYGLRSRCGSPYYVAPEMISGKGYGPSVDVWSLGVILYSILTGDVPFTDENITKLLENIVEGKYHLPRYLSESAKDLIRNILVTDPAKRYTLADVRRHPWMGMFPSPYENPELSTPINFPLDDDVVRQMEEIGFGSKLIAEYTKARTRNGVTNMYRILLSRKRIFDRGVIEKSPERSIEHDFGFRSASSIRGIRDLTSSFSKLGPIQPENASPLQLPPVPFSQQRPPSVQTDMRFALAYRLDETPPRPQFNPYAQTYYDAVLERRSMNPDLRTTPIRPSNNPAYISSSPHSNLAPTSLLPQYSVYPQSPTRASSTAQPQTPTNPHLTPLHHPHHSHPHPHPPPPPPPPHPLPLLYGSIGSIPMPSSAILQPVLMQQAAPSVICTLPTDSSTLFPRKISESHLSSMVS